jgi:hypothetical protein
MSTERPASPKSLAMTVREQRETQTVVREEIYKYAVAAQQSQAAAEVAASRSASPSGTIKYTPTSYNAGTTTVSIPVPTQTITMTTATVPYIAAPVGVVAYRTTYTPSSTNALGSDRPPWERCESFLYQKAREAESPWVYNY